MLRLAVPDGGVNLRQLNDELAVAGFPYSTMRSNRYFSAPGVYTTGPMYLAVKGDISERDQDAIILIVTQHQAVNPE